MGTTAHVRIHSDDSVRGSGVYHRYDGDTLGPHLVQVATTLNSCADPVTPAVFAQTWVATQNEQHRAEMARGHGPDPTMAEIVAGMMTSIELVADEDASTIPDWYDAYYTVTIVDGRVRTVSGNGDTEELLTVQVPKRTKG